MRTVLLLSLLILVTAPSAADESSAILSYDDYAEVTHGVPYILEYQAGDGRVVIVGVQHTNRTDSPLLPLLFREWHEFRPTVAFHEGTAWGIGNGPDDTIRQYGEPGVVRFLAITSRTPVTSLEPDMVEEIRYLAHAGWNPSQVTLFYTLRLVSERRQLGGPSDEVSTESIAAYLSGGFPRMPELNNRPHTLEDLESAFSEYLPGERSWAMAEPEWFDPLQSVHFTNEIARSSGRYRDEYMVERFVERVERGESVFVVVGYSHAVMIEPELTRRLGTPDRIVGRE